MAVTFQLESKLEDQLRHDLRDLDWAAKEALLVALLRQRKISRHEFSQALGLDRFETDALLHRHEYFEGSLTLEDLDADFRTLGRVLNDRS